MPALPVYLTKFTGLQYQAFHQMYAHDVRRKQDLLEDYAIIFGNNLSAIREYPEPYFRTKLSEIIKPLHQTASNLGFTPSWTYPL